MDVVRSINRTNGTVYRSIENNILVNVASETHRFPLCNKVHEIDEYSLRVNEVKRLVGDNRWRVILCLAGEIWVTQKKDLGDYVVKAGDLFIITQPGNVLLQALCESRVQITCRLNDPPFHGRFSESIFP